MFDRPALKNFLAGTLGIGAIEAVVETRCGSVHTDLVFNSEQDAESFRDAYRLHEEESSNAGMSNLHFVHNGVAVDYRPVADSTTPRPDGSIGGITTTSLPQLDEDTIIITVVVVLIIVGIFAGVVVALVVKDRQDRQRQRAVLPVVVKAAPAKGEFKSPSNNSGATNDSLRESKEGSPQHQTDDDNSAEFSGAKTVPPPASASFDAKMARLREHEQGKPTTKKKKKAKKSKKKAKLQTSEDSDVTGQNTSPTATAASPTLPGWGRTQAAMQNLRAVHVMNTHEEKPLTADEEKARRRQLKKLRRLRKVKRKMAKNKAQAMSPSKGGSASP